jgi:hypothetical protein
MSNISTSAKIVVSKGNCTPPWGKVVAIRGKGRCRAALEVGVVSLYTIEVTLDQILGNWYQLIKPIRRIEDLLTVVFFIWWGGT